MTPDSDQILPGFCAQTAQMVQPRLRKPTSCRYCNGVVVLSHHDLVFPRRSITWPYLYLCLKCKASVDTYARTDLPKGTLACAPLRVLRCQAQAAYENMREDTGMTQGEGVDWLESITGFMTPRCVFDLFEAKQCEAVIREAKILTDLASEIQLGVPA